MIVVEGFDGTGKSTLSEALGKELGWPVYHPGGPTKDLMDVAACLHRSNLRYSERCVQDRCTHISESVYSMMTRPDRAALALSHLGNLMTPRVVIHCRIPSHVVLDRIRNHVAKEHETEEHVRSVIENAAALLGIYNTVMALVERHRLVRVYDHTRHDLQAFIRTVKENLK